MRERIHIFDNSMPPLTTLYQPERHGWRDGEALKARFNYPSGLALGTPNGSLVLIADGYNHRIRRLDTRSMLVDTIAGIAPSTLLRQRL
jgi:hypothetical protein